MDHALESPDHRRNLYENAVASLAHHFRAGGLEDVFDLAFYAFEVDAETSSGAISGSVRGCGYRAARAGQRIACRHLGREHWFSENDSRLFSLVVPVLASM